MRITFTLDLEAHAPPGQRSRHGAATRDLLDRLARLGVRGTVFAVGELAEAEPDLIRAISRRGHEVGLHGWNHDPLPEVGPARFREDTARGKKLLEELTGTPVTGYRAPMFSLVPQSRWATDSLTELGFAYSSSVLPARSPLFGDPSSPTVPFRWPSGLLELPSPVARVGPIGVPYLGGTYLRMLPSPVIAALRAVFDRDQALWTYSHPYDFDPDEPRWTDPSVGRLGSPLLWYGRRRAWAKLARLLRDAAPPLGERLDELSPPS